MRRKYRIALMAGLLALMPMLSGCADFDIDSLDFLNINQKKKLPGERKEVFPGGVPGVTQGIPPEYLKGNQQQQVGSAVTPDTTAAPPPGGAAAPPPPAAKTAAIEAEPVKPKPKRKPKPHTATPQPKNVTVQPVAQGQQGSGQQQLEPWPGTAPQPAQGSSPWLTPPPPGVQSQ